MRFKNKAKTIFTVITICLVYMYGLIAIKHLIINKLINYPQSFILKLDNGRFPIRIFAAIWATVIFFLFINIIKGIKLKNSVLNPPNKNKYFWYGALFSTTLVFINIIITTLSGTLSFELGSDWQTQLPNVLLTYTTAMLLTAYSEELIMRGIALNALFEDFNPHIAIIATSLIFGCFHLYNTFIHATAAFIVGLILGYGFAYTRNLYFCIGFHFAWNCLESIIFGSDLTKVTIYNELLTGQRNVSPDQQGLISTLVVTAGFIFLILYFRNKKLF